MKSLENSDWIFLNGIIFQIYSIEDSIEMRRALIEQLRLLLDFDCATFYITSANDSRVLVNPVVYNISPELGEKYIKEYYSMDYAKSILFGGKSITYRETDIMPDDKRVGTEYYKTFYISCNWHYSISIVITYKSRFLGVLSLFRYNGEPNFEYDDVFILELLKNHLEYRLNRDISMKTQNEDKLTTQQCATEYGLTKREETILRFFINGLENNKICEDLCITNNTLKKHILNIYRKLGVKNRVQMLNIVKEKQADNYNISV